ncbi:MAG: LCCL domain-containing protein [Pyrinomonadaceae bacterium]
MEIKIMRSLYINVVIIVALLFWGYVSNVTAQEAGPVFPVPQFEGEAKRASSARLSIVMEEMREHLCHRPAANLPEAPAWNVRFNQLLTEMVVAQHVVVWTAAGEMTADEKALLSSFYDDKAKMQRLFDKLVPANESLRIPAETFRRGIDAHSPNVNRAGYAQAMLHVYALAALLVDVDKGVFRTMAEVEEAADYNSTMASMLKQLGALQFYIYTRGVEAVENKAPSDKSFPFRMYRLPAEMREVFYSAIVQKAISAARTSDVGAKDMTDFESLRPWQRVSEVYGVEFQDVYQNEVRGACTTQTVRVLFHKSREVEAMRAVNRLRASRFEVTHKAFDDSEKVGHRQKVYYQKNGTHGGADGIVEMLKDVEVLNAKAGTVSGAEGSPDYAVWITNKVEKKANTIRVSFTREREADADRAGERLRDEGYTVVTEAVGFESNKQHSNQLIYHTGRSATAAEAGSIADLLKDIEKLTSGENIAERPGILPAYDVWIISKKEEGTKMIGWYQNASDLVGKLGQQFTYVCSPYEGVGASAWGTDIYAADSAICPSAVHFGLITKEAGGRVTIEMRPGQSRYLASTRYGIKSGYWDAFPGSYVFVTPPNR